MVSQEKMKKHSSLRTVEMKSRRERIFRIVKTCIVLFLLGCAIWFAIQIRNMFLVQEVICRVDNRTCDSTYQTFTSSLTGKLIFSRIVLPQGTRGTVRRQFPHTVILSFVSPVIIGTIEAPDEQHILTLSELGFLQTATNSAGQQPVIIDHTIDSGAVATQVDAQTLAFYTALRHLLPTFPYAGLQSIEIVDPDTVKWKFEQGYIIITRRSEMETQLRTLQYVLQTPTIDITHHTVDLRFEQPVIE